MPAEQTAEYNIGKNMLGSRYWIGVAGVQAAAVETACSVLRTVENATRGVAHTLRDVPTSSYRLTSRSALRVRVWTALGSNRQCVTATARHSLRHSLACGTACGTSAWFVLCKLPGVAQRWHTVLLDASNAVKPGPLHSSREPAGTRSRGSAHLIRITLHAGPDQGTATWCAGHAHRRV